MLRVCQLQASGGISTLHSRASSLQSATQENSIRTKTTPPSQTNKDTSQVAPFERQPYIYIYIYIYRGIQVSGQTGVCVVPAIGETCDSPTKIRRYQAYMCICIYTYIYIYIYSYMYIYIYMCIYIYIYIYRYVCICMYVCIYIYIYIYTCVKLKSSETWHVVQLNTGSI